MVAVQEKRSDLEYRLTFEGPNVPELTLLLHRLVEHYVGDLAAWGERPTKEEHVLFDRLAPGVVSEHYGLYDEIPYREGF